MSDILVSVVIPIYNSETFLHECLDSLHKQTMKEIEFICVNDGSKDSSLDIINEYVEKDPRFKLLNKENSGYGVSMNMGFNLATGKYVGIVESDDYVEPNMFEELYKIADENKLDLIKSHFIRFTTNKDGTENSTLIKNTTNVNRVICPADYPKILMNTTANWTGLYSKSFLVENGIRHSETPGASYQDLGFHFLTLSLASRAYFVDKAYYHYRYDNPNSSINNKNKMYCACEEYDYVRRYYQDNPKIGNIFNGVLWAREHNTCLNTYARVAPNLKKEFLYYYVKKFKDALYAGQLEKSAFNDKRWKEMLSIIFDPEQFHKQYMYFRKRNKIKEKYEHVPIIYRLIWSVQDNGIKYTYSKITDEIKKSLNIKHWDRSDRIGAHVKIINRHILNKLHLAQYSKSISHVRELKNSYAGERCFIVCTGPSLQLNDLDVIKNEYTFGMNTIYLAYKNTEWRPTFYVCIDEYAQTRMSKEYEIDYNSIAKGPIILNDRIKTGAASDVYKIPVGFDNHLQKNIVTKHVRVEEDLSLCTYDCFSVTNFAIQCAIYMGFKEIFIIGCDCNYDGKVHFVQSKLDPKSTEKDRWNDAVSLSIVGYEAMKKYADEKNVKIYNATRGGHLEVFGRVDFDSIDFK